MAASETTSVDSEPNFAVICSFMQEHGEILGIPNISFNALQNYLEETRCVRRPLEELFLKLLRRWRSCSAEKWEKYLTKYAYTYSQVDAWELERLGFPRCKLSTKLRLLKNLLETQFDRNPKFKEKINEKPANVLRVLPIGRDKNSLAYWFLLDNDLNVRVYREDPDDVECETWEMVVSNRNDLANLISGLESGFDVKAEEKSRSTTPSAVSSDHGKDDGEAVKSEDKPVSGLAKEESDVTADKSNDVKTEASIKLEDTQGECDLKTADVKCDIPVKKEPPDPPDETYQCPISKDIDRKSEINAEPESKHETEISQLSKCQTPAVNIAEESSHKTKSQKESNDRPKIHEAADLESIPVKTDDKEKSCEENKIYVEQKLAPEKNKDAENLNKATNVDVATDKDTEDDTVSDKPNEIDTGSIQEKPSRNLEESKCSKETVDSDSVKSNIPSEDTNSKHLDALEDTKTKKPCKETDRCVVAENNKDKILNEGKENSSSVEKSSVVENESIRNRKPIKLTISNGKLKTSESTEDSKSEHEESSENNEKAAGEQATSTENVQTPENKDEKDSDSVNTKNDNKDTTDRYISESDAGTKKKTRLTRRCLQQVKKTVTEEEETPRQRKRRRCSSQSHKKEVKSESEISETHSESDTANDTEVPPTKKHRDWQRKKVRSKRRKKEPEPEDSEEETLDKLKKKPPRSQDFAEKEGEPEDQESSQKDGETQKGSTETESEEQVKKKRGRGRAKREKAIKDVSEEPSTKKGRRQGSVHLKKKLEPEAGFDTDDSIPLIQLRRSSRSTRGQRHFDPGIIPDTPVSKKKGEKKQDKKEEKRKRGRPKKGEETSKDKDAKQRKRRQTKAEKEEELAKSRKMKDESETDEEFVPGQEKKKKNKKKKGKKRRPKNQEDGTDYEDALFQQAVDELHEFEDSPSLHWSSSSTEIEPESDGSEYQPRGRNIKRAMARKHSVEGNAPTNDDKPCDKCEKYNHPELILLCDLCDAGYHTACLRPPLMIIPDGDWYCPTCEHGFLIKKLQEKLEMLTHRIKDQDRVKNMRARLDYVNISLANVIHTKEEVEDDEEYWRNREKRKKKERQRSEGRSYRPNYWESDESETDEESESEESESSSSEEEATIRRSHRQRKEISYKFEEFDELIFTAIEDEIKNAPEKPPPPPKPKGQSTGKDMSNILGISPEKDENEEKDDDDKEDEDDLDRRREEMKHRPSPVLKRKSKKGRKLTALDSGEDVGDDESEEYKASEDSPGSDASFEPDYLTDGSEEWLGRGTRRSSRHRGRVRKSGRRRKGRRRDLGDFVVEGDDDSDYEEKPTRRTGRSAGRRAVSYKEEPSSDEYSSEASGYRRKKRTSSKSTKKKRRRLVFSDDSEREQEDDNQISESEDDDGPKYHSRRAAAKKVNYREMAHRYSDDSDAPKKKMAVSNFIKSDDGSATDNYFDEDGNSKDDKDSDESDDSQSTAGADRTDSQSDSTQQTANLIENSHCDKPAQKVSNSENCNINGSLETHTSPPSGQDSKASGVKLLTQNRTIDQNGGPKVTSAKNDPSTGSIDNEPNSGSVDSDIDDQLFEEDEEDLESVAELVELVSKQ